MLPGTIARQYRDQDMRIDLQRLCERASARLLIADVKGLDLDSGMIEFDNHPPIAFDLLSIGVGSLPAGWQAFAQSPSVVAIKPMQTFMERLEARIRFVEANRTGKLRIGIVGGGVAGVEIAFCLHASMHQRNSGRDFEITLYTAGQSVAEGMRPGSIRRIERLLDQRGIHVCRNQRVGQVTDTSLITDDQQSHRVDCVIWATGAAAPPVLGKLGLQTDAQGFIATSNTLQSLTDQRIFAVGDAGTIISTPTAKAGVYAVRQCPILWHNLRAMLTQQSLVHYRPQRDFLKLINTGDGKSLMEYKRLTFHARWCWLLKTAIDKRFIREFQD